MPAKLAVQQAGVVVDRLDPVVPAVAARRAKLRKNPASRKTNQTSLPRRGLDFEVAELINVAMH
jgi:hypothetical protein